jgi:hypothetical protein
MEPYNSNYERALALIAERSRAPVARLAPDVAVTLCPCCLNDGRHEVLVIRRIEGDRVEIDTRHGKAA